MLYQDLIGTILWGIFIPVNKVPLAKPDKKRSTRQSGSYRTSTANTN
jgi:hypothetical protein